MIRLLALALLFLCVASPTRAQRHATDRSSVLIDGSAGYTRRHFEHDRVDIRTSELEIAPSVQYFVRSGLAVGATLDFSRAHSEYVLPVSSSTDSRSRSIGIGPTLSYYHGSFGDRWIPFVTATYTFRRYEIEDATEETEDESTSWEGALGVLYLARDRVGLTAELFYRDGRREYGSGGESDETVTGLRIGIATFLF
jgi:hypothetical protein